MKNLIFLIAASIVFSCKKDAVAPAPPVDTNNKFDATITLTSGEVWKFSAVGSDVVFGCNPYSYGSFITANQSPAEYSLTVFSNDFNCVSGPGSYNSFWCNYYQNKKSQAPAYSTGFGPDYHPGSVTYTVFNGKYAEGYFNVVHKISATDSVLMKGTFSGYRKW